jgi:site-specific DNA-methyltransferase (adenine-specific)
LRKTDLFKRRVVTPVERIGSYGFLTRSDAIEMTMGMRDEVVDLAFIDPPFNLHKNYGEAREPETVGSDEYEQYIVSLLDEVIRVLRPGAALFMYHLPYWAGRLSGALQRKLLFRHWIAISMKNGFVRGQRLYPAHYALLYYTKGKPTTFERPKIKPQLCRHCGKVVKDYGGYKEIINEKGINLSDFWDDLSPVRHKTTRVRRANQLPTLLTDRVVAIAGKPGGVFLDPFVGSGTSLLSCVTGKMCFIGNDLDPDSIKIARERLKRFGGGCEGCD